MQYNIDKNILKEYIDFIMITNVFRKNDIRNKTKIFNKLQFLIEQRVLYRVERNMESLSGYEDIDDDERKYFEKFFIGEELKYPLRTYLKEINKNIVTNDEYINDLKTIEEFDMNKFLEYHKLSKEDIDIILMIKMNKCVDELKKMRKDYLNLLENKNKNFVNFEKRLKAKYKNKYNKIIINKNNNDNNIVHNMIFNNITINFFYNDMVKGKFVKKIDNRLNYLYNKGGADKLLCMILRYLCYGITGQHISLPIKVYDYFYDNLNIKGEGFASPFNSKLIEKKDTVFCSLFHDTDKWFGSQGAFSAKVLINNGEKFNFSMNPPYIPEVIQKMYDYAMEAFEKIERKNFMVVILIPRWTDNNVYMELKKSKYLIKLLELDEGKHYMNCNGNYRYMRGVINSMFFLSKDKNAISENHICNITKLWNEKNCNDTQQSYFCDPIFDDCER
jgi:hypothetical protein